MKRYIVALSGASGVIYGIRLIQELSKRGYEVHIIASEPSAKVMTQELGWRIEGNVKEALRRYLAADGNVKIYNNDEIDAAPASGSFLSSGMIVIPCSMASVSAMAHGSARTLLERSADVMIKEKRRLVVVPRETPLSTIHLNNMLTLAQTGAHILPAMPAFYHQPVTVDDLVDFIVGKVLDVLEIPHQLFKRYTGNNT